MQLKDLFEFINQSSTRWLEELKVFLRQPSVSAQRLGVRECAELLEGLMAKAGIQTEIIPINDDRPVVYGEVKLRPNRKTLLIYSHYDVQPPEPMEEWKYPPFSAKVHNGRIYARGAADSKGNVLAQVKAAEAFLKVRRGAPINLKFLFEGEEEIGSPSLPRFVRDYKDKLVADAVVCFDGGMEESGRPRVNLGLKGLLYIEIKAKGAKTDLHSGKAPIIPSPVWRLIWALNTLKERDERILIDGFYDDVKLPTNEELDLLQEIPFAEEKIKQEYGIDEFLGGRRGLDALRALIYQPTCNVCGIISGYTRANSKTVLPREAMAKIDFRLVPEQKPEDIFKKIKRHLKVHGFNDLEVIKVGALEPSKTPITADIAQAVIKSAEKVYGVKAVIYPSSEGSGPDYLFTKYLGLPSVWCGGAPPFSNAHAPNEFTTIEYLLKSVKYAVAIIQEFSSI